MAEEPPGKAVEFNIKLAAGEHTIEASARIPDRPLRVTDLLPILLSFDEAVIGLAASQVERQGKQVPCRAGCAACCRQLTPIGESEAYYLAELVDSMPVERQQVVRERFRKTLAALEERQILARLRRPWELKALEDRRKIGTEYFALGIPCPFLEEERCSIHPHRPMCCREYLVTSPAVNCRTPGPETIQKVPLPVKFSEILYTFGDGVGRQATRWLPLVLALEWVAERKKELPPAFPGPQLFRNFLSLISAIARKTDQPPAV
jgi:Fe-S-cluster containining protein